MNTVAKLSAEARVMSRSPLRDSDRKVSSLAMMSKIKKQSKNRYNKKTRLFKYSSNLLIRYRTAKIQKMKI